MMTFGPPSLLPAAAYSPALALGVGVVVALLSVVAFWPHTGLIARWTRFRRANARVLAEDALKHLCKCELEERVPTLASIAGALQISLNHTADVVEYLQSHRLIASREGEFELTAEGRNYGMNIIRAHRLWERHLADQTGLAEAEWHGAAERKEHRLTPEQADALSASLGHPTHDPHGDPIPTAEGEIAPAGGRSLAAMKPGQAVRITHIEDEPEAVYAQLVADGLHVGQVLRVSQVEPDRVSFWSEGEERRLAPVIAANVTVAPVESTLAEEHPGGRGLHTLAPGEAGVVQSLSPLCRGPERRRFLDLGILPGTRVQAEMRSPGGDPTAYRIRDSLIALRQEQARLILLSPESEAA
ncbi:MAG: FeoA domain-containing protein [Verrucomicrobiales bacterium]|nr:FeoA domain-containing protein [Verrucomicrobiales bacterium]